MRSSIRTPLNSNGEGEGRSLMSSHHLVKGVFFDLCNFHKFSSAPPKVTCVWNVRRSLLAEEISFASFDGYAVDGGTFEFCFICFSYGGGL